MSSLKNVIVFGSHGKVGQRLIKQLGSDPSFTVTAVVRNNEQASRVLDLVPSSAKLKTVNLDLDEANVKDITKAIESHGSVIFTAGSGGKKLLEVDLDGAVKTFEATVIAKVRRFVLVSAIFAENREFHKESSIRRYYIAKHYADRLLQSEFKLQLDFTILKPTLLTDGPGIGKIKFLENYNDHEVGSVDREDVARVISAVLEEPKTYGQSINFTSGNEDISKAIKSIQG